MIQTFNWFSVHQPSGLHLEPSERNGMLPDNDIISLKYHNKTLIAQSNQQFIYLLERPEGINLDGGSHLTFIFKMRINCRDLNVLGERLIVDDIKVM